MLALLLCSALAVQDGDLDEPIPETVVTAPRSEQPASASGSQVTVVTGDELRATGERSLPRALSRAGGIWVQETNMAGGAPFLRGLVGNQVLIVVDGIRLNDATTRSGPNQSLNSIDPAIVDRIEVVRGPASVLYGSDAVGGAILIWTKRALPNLMNPSGDTGLFGGADATFNSAVGGGRASVFGSWVSETDGVIVIGSGFDFDDLEAANGTQEFTGYDGQALFGSWTHAFDADRSLNVTARWLRNNDADRTDRLVVGFSGSADPRNEVFQFEREQREGYMVTYDHRRPSAFADAFQARLALRRYAEIRNEQGFGSDTLSRETDDVDTIALGLDFKKALGADHLLTWGLDLNHDQIDSGDTETDLVTETSEVLNGDFAPGSEYTTLGLFVQDEIFAFDPFDVTAGLRFTHSSFEFGAFPDVAGSMDEDGSFSQLTASLQAARDVADGVRVTGTLAQGFRAPNLDELAKNEGDFALGQELASPDLDPEKSLSAELALDIDKGLYSSSTAAFYTRIDDIIGRAFVGEVDGVPQFDRQNFGEAAIWGFETAHRRRLADDSPFSIEASAVFTRGREYDRPDGDGNLEDVDFRRIPPLHGRAALDWRPDEPEFEWVTWALAEVIWASKQDKLHPGDVSDSRIDPDGTPGWGVLNLEVGGPFDEEARGHWWVGVHNVFDEAYRIHGSGFDAAGRALVVGLSWRP